MAIDLKLIDAMLADYKSLEDIIGENGLLKQSSSMFFFWLVEPPTSLWLGAHILNGALSSVY